jgi:hypothetical protein
MFDAVYDPLPPKYAFRIIFRATSRASTQRLAWATNGPAEYLPKVIPLRLCPTTSAMMFSGRSACLHAYTKGDDPRRRGWVSCPWPQ